MSYEVQTWNGDRMHAGSRFIIADSMEEAIKKAERPVGWTVTCYKFGDLISDHTYFASIPNVSWWSINIAEAYPHWTHKIIEF